MISRDQWRAAEGRSVTDDLLLRGLIETGRAPIFAATFRENPVMVRFWTDDDGDVQAILDRHREAQFLQHPGLLPCLSTGLGQLSGHEVVWAAYEPWDALLSEFLTGGPRTPAEVRDLAIGISDPLAFLHGNDLVYCNLDPSSVARKKGRWVLADYSQLRLAGAYGQEMRKLLVSLPGTPPEAFEGMVTPAWDAWSLAHLVRTALLGLRHRRYGNERPARHEKLPEPFAALMAECTSSNPADRCSIGEIADRLKRAPLAPDALSDPMPDRQPVAVSLSSEPHETTPVRRDDMVRKRLLEISLALLAVIAAVALVFIVRSRVQERPAVEQAEAGVERRETERPSPIVLPDATEQAADETRSRADQPGDVAGLIDRWASTFRSGDVDAHVALYAPRVERFFRSRNVSRDFVRKTKQEAFAGIDDVRDYTLSNVQTRMQGSDRAVVTFDKTFDFAGSRPHSGKVRSELRLRRINGEWRIASERDTRVYWQKRA